jgi:hypothetical protein
MQKRRLEHTLVLSIFLVVLVSGTISGKDVNGDVGGSAFPFLKINLAARAVAMGGAATGVAEDESSLYYNPAGIAGLDNRRYILGYHNYFVDMQSGIVGYIHSLRNQRALAVYASYLNFGEFTETDLDGNVQGSFGGGDLLLAASFAMQRTHRLAVGATAKFIYQKIQNFSATGLAFDIGARYSSDRGRLTAGLMLQNLGTQLSTLGEGERDGLPTSVRTGIGARPRGLPLLLAADLVVPFDNDLHVALGAEYYELKPLYLRLGWNSFGSNYRADDSDDSLAGFSVGVGFDYRLMQLSYAFSPAADLGDSHRITLTGGF